MACDGPSKEEAFILGDRIATQLIERLKKEYHIEVGDTAFYQGKNRENWDRLEANFRNTIKEIVWLDWATGF